MVHFCLHTYIYIYIFPARRLGREEGKCGSALVRRGSKELSNRETSATHSHVCIYQIYDKNYIIIARHARTLERGVDLEMLKINIGRLRQIESSTTNEASDAMLAKKNGLSVNDRAIRDLQFDLFLISSRFFYMARLITELRRASNTNCLLRYVSLRFK
ncbi:hypothetical protein PUN28_018922 [Cardiocondyla obscurior]|uniref:Uncharacterized protein n=1 Tax=Cardiocondyla obscurior TaxID=286306 RepID=A0AAW2ECL6_9HYME